MQLKLSVAASLLAANVLTFQASAQDAAPSSTSPFASAEPITQLTRSLKTMADRNDPAAERYTIAERMAFHGVPGAAVAVIEGGEVAHVVGFGTRRAGEDMPVDGNTVFSAGSISKLVNAALVLRLVQEGTLDLDADVRGYLKRWQPRETRRSRGVPVTLRQLLSHTAGLSQGGFPDFQPGEPLPTLVETLNGEGPAKHGAITFRSRPGAEMRYSGGGTTVSQLVVERSREIAVRLVPLPRIAAMIREGHIHHALVVAAFHFLELARRGADAE